MTSPTIEELLSEEQVEALLWAERNGISEGEPDALAEAAGEVAAESFRSRIRAEGYFTAQEIAAMIAARNPELRRIGGRRHG